MAARHRHKKATGGTAEDPEVKTIDNSKESGVYKEAEEKKRGGRAKKKHGGKAHLVSGGKAEHHLGRPGRKRGGRAGADKMPLSSAAHVTHEGSTAGAEHEKHGGMVHHGHHR